MWSATWVTKRLKILSQARYFCKVILLFHPSQISCINSFVKNIGVGDVDNLCFNARHYNTHRLSEQTGLPRKSHLKAYSSLSMFSRDMDAESFYTDQSHCINQKVKLFSLVKMKWILWTAGIRSMVRILLFFPSVIFQLCSYQLSTLSLTIWRFMYIRNKLAIFNLHTFFAEHFGGILPRSKFSCVSNRVHVSQK